MLELARRAAGPAPDAGRTPTLGAGRAHAPRGPEVRNI